MYSVCRVDRTSPMIDATFMGTDYNSRLSRVKFVDEGPLTHPVYFELWSDTIDLAFGISRARAEGYRM